MAVLVKICGINSAEAADAALRAGADFAGLVFHPSSPRHVTAEQARSLAQRLRGRVQLTALLVDPRDDEITYVMTHAVPDFLQLHGSETPARVSQIRQRFGIPVIKALAIAEPADFATLPAQEEAADMILFDAKPPAHATRTGGHGIAFDWQMLRTQNIARPWFLAGGLTAENVGRALTASKAPGVDVSSGVETAPGVKSAVQIEQFVAAARSIQFAGAA